MESYFQELQHENEGENTGSNKDTLESRLEENKVPAAEANELSKEWKKEHNRRPHMKNRLLNALIGKQQKQLQDLSKIEAEEKVLFDFAETCASGGSANRLDTEEDSEARLDDLALRAHRIMTDYREYRDAMAEAGEQDAVLLVSGRWSMFCYRLHMYEEAQKILVYAARCLHEALEESTGFISCREEWQRQEVRCLRRRADLREIPVTIRRQQNDIFEKHMTTICIMEIRAIWNRLSLSCRRLQLSIISTVKRRRKKGSTQRLRQEFLLPAFVMPCMAVWKMRVNYRSQY